jgi:integrase
MHGLRHSFASLSYFLGIPEAETMRLGGWSDPSVMRKIYTHLASTLKTDARTRLQAFFRPAA